MSKTELIADAAHGQRILKDVSNAKDRVEVVVPYFDRTAVDKLLRALPKGVQLAFTFGWPREDDLAVAISPAALERVMKRGGGVSYVAPEGRLHAKVYIIDGRVGFITSANLTACGLGLRDRDANGELGVRTTDKRMLSEIAAWIGGLGHHPLTRRELSDLTKWAERGFATPPKPPAPTVRAQDIVDNALTRARDAKMIRSYELLRRGYGRNAVRVRIPGLRPLIVRARISTRAPVRNGFGYHFEVYPKDLELNRLDGFILIPVDEQRGPLDFAEAPLVWLPFGRVVGRGGKRLSKSRINATSGGRRLSLERAGDGWAVRAGRIKLDLDGCENSTRSFHAARR